MGRDSYANKEKVKFISLEVVFRVLTDAFS